MKILTTESTSVQSYLSILQNVINRMAANSASCKTWCITLVSAILVLVVDKAKPEYASISLVPILIFFFLDSYYLALERQFRDLYNSFITKLHNDKATIEDVFIVSPSKDIVCSIFKALFSISVLPFYTTLACIVYFSTKYLW